MTITNVNHPNNNVQPKQNKEVQGDHKDLNKCKHQKVYHWPILLAWRNSTHAFYSYWTFWKFEQPWNLHRFQLISTIIMYHYCIQESWRPARCQQCRQRNVRNQDRLVQRYMVPCPPRPSSLSQNNVCKFGDAVQWRLRRINPGFPSFCFPVAVNCSNFAVVH